MVEPSDGSTRHDVVHRSLLVVPAILMVLCGCTREDENPTASSGETKEALSARTPAPAQGVPESPRPDPTKAHRLSPKHFPELPEEIRKYLAARKCSIPPPSSNSPRLNVIRGEFFAKRQISWAVLCSAGGNSVIQVSVISRILGGRSWPRSQTRIVSGPTAPTHITYEKFTQ